MEFKKLGQGSYRVKAKKTAFTVARGRVELTEEMVFERPGEYEVGGVSVFGFRVGEGRLFAVHADELALVGAVGVTEELSEKQLDDIGPVDVLLVDAGGAKLVKALSPAVVIVEGEEKEVSALAEKAGVGVEKLDKLSLGKDDLPEETRVVVLA